MKMKNRPDAANPGGDPGWTILVNGTVVTPEGTREWDLILRRDRIAGVLERGSGTVGAISAPAGEFVGSREVEVSGGHAGGLLELEGGDAGKGASIGKVVVRLVQCESDLVFPGLVDAHAHFRDLNQSDKETFETASRAAVKGGVTTTCVMPNTDPPVVSPGKLDEYVARAKGRIYCDVCFWAGVPGNLRERDAEALLSAGVAGFKVYPHSPLSGIDWLDAANWKRVMRLVVESGKALAIHPDYPVTRAERERRYDKAIRSGLSPLKAHERVHPVGDELEFVALIRDLAGDQSMDGLRGKLAVHFCHVSSREEARALFELRGVLPKLTVEVTPHHLLLSLEDFEDHEVSEDHEASDGRPARAGRTTGRDWIPQWAKVLPPLRTRAGKLPYPDILQPGGADLVATDHAPHTLGEKARSFFQAPSGFPGNELFLPLLCTEVFRGKIEPAVISRLCCANPARFLGLEDAGVVAAGARADLVVVERCPPTAVQPENFETKAHYSPYVGMPFEARVKHVFLRGNWIVRDGEIQGPPLGKVLELGN
ncbi:MAG: dihydroorotase [Promethearchaeota archaeon]